ncbi:MAG: DUF739 family protein [Clostridiales bacterium]|nr:DUF739 family protein [Clostridiales bacterium]
MRTDFDYSKLRGRIKEICGTQDVFAGRIGLGTVSVSQRLNNSLEFSQMEITRALDVLNLTPADIPLYFFTKKVQKTELDHGTAEKTPVKSETVEGE